MPDPIKKLEKLRTQIETIESNANDFVEVLPASVKAEILTVKNLLDQAGDFTDKIIVALQKEERKNPATK